MALTPEQIYGLRVRSGMGAFRTMKEHWQAKDDDAAYHFARAIEAEVRKQDETLIRQLVEAVEALEAMQSEAAARSCGLRICDEAIAIGRARLEGNAMTTDTKPVEREPLSDEEVDSLCKVGPVYAPDGKVTLTPHSTGMSLRQHRGMGCEKANELTVLKDDWSTT